MSDDEMDRIITERDRLREDLSRERWVRLEGDTERDRLRAAFVDGAHGQMGGPELVAGIYEFPLAPGFSTRFGFCPVCRMVWPPDGSHECQAQLDVSPTMGGDADD